jgi:hypothetical protein
VVARLRRWWSGERRFRTITDGDNVTLYSTLAQRIHRALVCGSIRRWIERNRFATHAPPVAGWIRRSSTACSTSCMPSPTSVRHEWKKHGTCTGLSPADYFEKVRAARSLVRIPEA